MSEKTKTTKTTRKPETLALIETLSKEYGVKARSVTKALIKVIEKLNKIITPENLGKDFNLQYYSDYHPKLCWYEGNIHRCTHYQWVIYHGELCIRKTTDYSGEGAWYADPTDVIESLANHKHYNVIIKLAGELLSFLHSAVTDLKVMIKNREDLKDRLEAIAKACD